MSYSVGAAQTEENRGNLPQVKGAFTTLRYRWLNTLAVTQRNLPAYPDWNGAEIEAKTLWNN